MSGGGRFFDLSRSRAQRFGVHARVVQFLKLALHHFLILVIRHAEPARARAQNGDTELAAVDELADQARQQALFLSSPSGSARRKSLKYASSFSNSHGVKPQKFIETGVSGA